MPRATYLDNACTSLPKPDVVWQAARSYLDEIGASPGRGGYRLARRADQVVEDARAKVAQLLGVANTSNIVFTANATHALNTAIQGVLRKNDHVVTTTIEHNSVLRPLAALARAGVITWTSVAVAPDGLFDLAAVQAAMRPETRLLIASHASNVIGSLSPAAELAAIAHRHEALFLLDAAQSAGSIDIDVDALGADLLAITGHKGLRGPSGIGALYVREPRVVDSLTQGGTGSNSHALVHPAGMPAKFEAGTLNYLGIVGLAAAIEPILRDGASRAHQHTDLLTLRCLEELRRIPDVTVYEVNEAVQRLPVISINVRGLYAQELCAVLDERFSIMTRAGIHCAPLIHKFLGTAPHGTLRVSLGVTNDDEDVDALVAALKVITSEVAAR